MKIRPEKEDKFKEAFRKKVLGKEKPALSQSDKVLWENISQEIQSGSVVPLWKRSYFRYAASILLFSVAGAFTYFFINGQDENMSPAEVAVVTEKSPSENKDVFVSDPIIEDPTANEEVVEEKKPSVGKENTSENIAGTPVFNKVESSESLHDLSLADGSQITLNAESSVAYHFDSELRIVRLQSGEAFFDVVKDQEKPFIVQVSDYEIKVIGTQFSVRNFDNEPIEVTVLEGSVLFYTKDNPETPVSLSRGDQAQVNTKGEIITSKVNSEGYIAWKTKKLDFSNADLSYVIKILERIHNVEINADNKLSKCNFTGNLSGFSIEEALNVISLANSVKAEEKNGSYYLTGSCD